MTRRSPTLEGFRAVFSRPSLGLAEIAWRWSFCAATFLLLAFSFFEYLDSLPVAKRDLFLLRTAQPILISRALLHTFRGSGFRVLATALVLALTLGIGWVLIASLARLATLKALLDYFRQREISTAEPKEEENRPLRSLFALNFLRFGVTLAATMGWLAAFVLAGAVSRPADPAPGSALLIFLTIAMLVSVRLVHVELVSLACNSIRGGRCSEYLRRNRRRRRSVPNSRRISLRRRNVVWIGPPHRLRRRQFDCRLPAGFCRGPSRRRGHRAARSW